MRGALKRKSAEDPAARYCRAVPTVRPAPRYWFWSHDIRPDQVAGLAMPGMRLQRLVSYRRGAPASRRFAALYWDDDGAIAAPSRTWLVDADAAAAAAAGPRAAGVSVDVVPGSGEARFTLILEPQPDPARTFHPDLSPAAVAELIDAGHTVVDLATYLRGGTRVFAAIVELRTGHHTSFFPALSHADVRRTLGPPGVLPTRVRAYHSPAGWRLAIVGERIRGTAWSVHVDLDGDDVSSRLEQHRAYPLDLDAVGHGLSVRFAVVAAA
ncbi:hypothetical protein MSAS_20820 [Mycobacterium saskatchewanense]|uniref:Uncharacterized protein n=1 Tax=Mycobacterium saskatchewanense TaxID=220927 RepID=A0AAJ3TUD8_9MYCO|nr:hypothetical protein AWC23_02190 [Mycobacterium saskatchewanense]BBX62908.1 hypothetical protein MSAS_20820 [Mycobacterium saskatchewanense]